jgi:hypothetical protein
MTHRIRAHHKKSKAKIIPQTPSKLKEHILFSFRYLDFSNKKFQFPENKPDYFINLIHRLQETCKITLEDFRITSAKSFHSHAICWITATENQFKNLPKQLQDGEDWQFSITKVKYGRIHGVLLDNIFFIVWFDPYHKLSPQK